MGEIFDAAAWRALLPWTPLIISGFLVNILISIVSMVLGMFLGAVLGMLQFSRIHVVVNLARYVSLLFRNVPWLVAMFFAMYLIPFNIDVMDSYFSFPVWLKAAIALAIPAAGFFSEVVRGGIAYIPKTQWEAAEGLGFGFYRTVFFIIVPQSLKRMIPPTITLYASITLGTSLASVVGAQESLGLVLIILNVVQQPGIMFAAYAFVLLLFFVYIFPISLVARRMERRLERESNAKH